MNWGSLGNFLAMGGYAGYVWSAYGVTVVLIVVEVFALRARRRTAVREVMGRAHPAVEE
jgi:heme exporter protein D